MRILVIEDNVRLAKSIARGLEKNSYAVDYIHDGAEAFDHFVMHYQAYDVVLLDLMLPGRSGMDVCRSIRERDIHTPIIVITAKDEMADKLHLLNIGADDYVEKPFAFAELLARIRAVNRRPDAMLNDELIFDKVRMVVSNHRVFVDEKELSLTMKEFAILELFLRNPNTVLSREYVLDHVWNYQYNINSNVVDAHVKNLRKKLGDTESGDIIQTVSGMGYRIKA